MQTSMLPTQFWDSRSNNKALSALMQQSGLFELGGLIAGVDEAGRGPLAGPVVAAAVILRLDDPIEGLADSKKLSAARRTALAYEIRKIIPPHHAQRLQPPGITLSHLLFPCLCLSSACHQA